MKPRRRTPQVPIGTIFMGSDHPVVIQSMTNTDTADVESTSQQILELHEAGAQVIRLTVNDDEAAAAIPKIVELINKKIPPSPSGRGAGGEGDECPIPLVGDFHFNGNKLLKKFPETAKLLAKYRINPGNADDTNFREMVEIAIANNKPVRIGVNGGSLDQKVLDELMDLNLSAENPRSSDELFIEAMVKSALQSAELAEQIGLPKDKIILSGKVSELQLMVPVYQKLAHRSDYALHLGLTEAGSGDFGIIQSSAALSILLQEGIGDTIRISLTPSPGSPRSKEVETCKMLLQALDLKRFRPKVTSCPGCGRTTSTFFQELAEQVNNKIDQNMKQWKQDFPGVENLKIAVMGCVVNGPGESKNANIAISLPGKMERAQAPVYIEGQLHSWLKGDDIDEQFMGMLDDYIAKTYGNA